MHILVVNDDGPPSNQSSPYVHSLVHTLQKAGHEVSVVLPHQQRSWIGKAHFVGETVKPTYFRPGTLHHDDGTVHHLPLSDDEANGDSNGNSNGDTDEWVLIDSTPASCVQIGLYHFFQHRGPVDLVISGPNYGRNTTAIFSLSSGTVGGAMEAAVCGKKAIALSYAFSSRDHDPVVIAEASRHSVKLIEHLCKKWDDNVDVYSVNVPLEPGVSAAKILFTRMLDNRWKSGSCFDAVDAEASGEDPSLQEQKLRQQGEKVLANGVEKMNMRHQHKHFKWAPKFGDVYRSVDESAPGNDGWAVKEGITSVTPLKASFMHAPDYEGEIKFAKGVLTISCVSTTRRPTSTITTASEPVIYALIDSENSYVQDLVTKAIKTQLRDYSQCQQYVRISSLAELPDPKAPLLQYREYENIDFEHAHAHPCTSLINAYVIRKALIRKHYLSNTVAYWVAKHPGSVLGRHVKPSLEFELDYAEFLDEALVEAFELRDSLDANEDKVEEEREWWILKPGMSDQGHGIRLFNSEDQLREIFEEWEELLDDSDEDEEEEIDVKQDEKQPLVSIIQTEGVATSHLRHFVVQPYIDPPLLLPSASNKKFHIRTYVLVVGSLKVYVWKEMLALFAEKPYMAPGDRDADVTDLSRHLTNTCLQEDPRTAEEKGDVRRFWALDDELPPSSSVGNNLPNGHHETNWKESVYSQIRSITAEVFEAAARGMPIHFQTLPNAFELFGVDFLVDASGHAWLLELNAFPDFGKTGEELKDVVVGRLFEEVVNVAVKPFFFSSDSSSSSLNGREEKESGLDLVADLDLGRRSG